MKPRPFWLPLLIFLGTTPEAANRAVGADVGGQPRSESAARAQADDIRRLVEQLGHEKFAQREAAARALIALGLPAFGPLKDAAQHPDPEVRYRAEKLVVEVRQRDFQRRLQVFAANRETSEEYDLPGWGDFRRLVGDTRETRDLFVKMQSDEPRLMQSLEKGPKAASEELNFRGLQMFQPFAGGRTPSISLGSAAAVLFVAGRGDVALSDLAASGVYRVCTDQALPEALNAGPYRAALRTLLSAWIVSENGAAMDYQKLLLAIQYDLKAGLAPAVQILEQAGRPPHLRQQALLATAKFGDESHIPLLENYLTDETAYGSRRLGNDKSVPTEMRDVALAALVVLTKQNLKDFGMPHVVFTPPFLFSPTMCGFETPQAREDALAKWRAYRSKPAGG